MKGQTDRSVIAAAASAAQRRHPATLAVVLETEGSTYVAPGSLALFVAEMEHVGWLSGGCLEPEIERVALACAEQGHMAWMEVDTRDDEDLLAGSALGCRGRLRIALLPLAELTGVQEQFETWLKGRARLAFSLRTDGKVNLAADSKSPDWQLRGPAPDWAGQQAEWHWYFEPPAEVLVFGAGPETATLLPLLHKLGWMSTLIERRPRWRDQVQYADRHVDRSPATVLQSAHFDAALIMNHNFELDREALESLAIDDTAFIGLLGPIRRREDLFRVLPTELHARLRSRLHSPVGLNLGGRGAQAIALSIAAQLNAWLHARQAS